MTCPAAPLCLVNSSKDSEDHSDCYLLLRSSKTAATTSTSTPMDTTPLSRRSAAIDRINRNISIGSSSSSKRENIIMKDSLSKPLPNDTLIDIMDLKRLRRVRRRRDPNRVKGILKKTSSYGGKLDAAAAYSSDDNSCCGPPKKRVSFPGLTSSRWDSQGAISQQSLKAPGALRWNTACREEPPSSQSNHVWKSKSETASSFPADSLSSLYLRAKKSRVSPVVEHKRKVAIQQAFQNITLPTP